MGLLLNYLVSQQNDAKGIIITDNTEVYDAASNIGGWGTPNTDLSDIDGAVTTLALNITITTSGGSAVVYDTIDCRIIMGGTPTSVADLVYTINASHLKISGVAIGTSEDTIPDGIYDIVYSVDFDETGGTGSPANITDDFFLYGIVYIGVVDALRDIAPKNYLLPAKELRLENYLNLLQPLSQLQDLEATIIYATDSTRDEMLDILGYLETKIL